MKTYIHNDLMKIIEQFCDVSAINRLPVMWPFQICSLKWWYLFHNGTSTTDIAMSNDWKKKIPIFHKHRNTISSWKKCTKTWQYQWNKITENMYLKWFNMCTPRHNTQRKIIEQSCDVNTINAIRRNAKFLNNGTWDMAMPGD